MIIDAHAHGLTLGYLETLRTIGGDLARKSAESQLERAKRLTPLVDIKVRVEQLERHSIDLQVVTPPISLTVNVFPGDAPIQLALARALNDNMASVMEESNGRVVAAGTTTLTFFEEGGRQEMERAIKTLGLKAIALPTNVLGKQLDAPEFESFWAHVEEMDVPVYLHPYPQPGRPSEADYDITHTFGWPYETTIALTRLVFSGIMERYPRLKIVTHHLGGGMIPFFMGRILETNDQSGVYSHNNPILTRPLDEYFSRFYYDTAVGGSAAAVRCAYEVFGADQIVFATDGPNGPKKGEARLASYPEVVKSLGLPPEDTEKIMAGNARRLLKLT